MRWTFILLLLALLPAAAGAYVGPGAGLGMIGSLLAVVGAVVLAIVGLVLLPFRLILKKRRKQANPEDDAPPATD